MSSPSRPTIQIHILREEGTFLARCQQLDIMTQGDTVEDLVAAATLAAEGAFRTYRARARLTAADGELLMTRLTAPLPRNDGRRKPASEAKVPAPTPAPTPIADAKPPAVNGEPTKDE